MQEVEPRLLPLMVQPWTHLPMPAIGLNAPQGTVAVLNLLIHIVYVIKQRGLVHQPVPVHAHVTPARCLLLPRRSEDEEENCEPARGQCVLEHSGRDDDVDQALVGVASPMAVITVMRLHRRFVRVAGLGGGGGSSGRGCAACALCTTEASGERRHAMLADCLPFLLLLCFVTLSEVFRSTRVPSLPSCRSSSYSQVCTQTYYCFTLSEVVRSTRVPSLSSFR